MRTCVPQMPPPLSEANVLKGLRGAAEEHRGARVVAAARGAIALGDPRGRAMRCGRELVERVLRVGERRGRLVETALLELGAAEDEPGVAEMVELILAVAEDLDRVPRLLLGEGDLADAEVDLGERGASARG